MRNENERDMTRRAIVNRLLLLLCSVLVLVPRTPERLSAAAAIDQSILPAIYQTNWDPGIPGGIPADTDPVRPATVWVPAGNPYGGYSVNPALTGQGNAAAFTSARVALPYCE